MRVQQVIAFEEDDLDLADFDPIEYINQKFPKEGSLRELDAAISKVRTPISRLSLSSIVSLSLLVAAVTWRAWVSPAAV